jgi:hypothetical protein
MFGEIGEWHAPWPSANRARRRHMSAIAGLANVARLLRPPRASVRR